MHSIIIQTCIMEALLPCHSGVRRGVCLFVCLFACEPPTNGVICLRTWTPLRHQQCRVWREGLSAERQDLFFSVRRLGCGPSHAREDGITVMRSTWTPERRSLNESLTLFPHAESVWVKAERSSWPSESLRRHFGRTGLYLDVLKLR